MAREARGQCFFAGLTFGLLVRFQRVQHLLVGGLQSLRAARRRVPLAQSARWESALPVRLCSLHPRRALRLSQRAPLTLPAHGTRALTPDAYLRCRLRGAPLAAVGVHSLPRWHTVRDNTHTHTCTQKTSRARVTGVPRPQTLSRAGNAVSASLCEAAAAAARRRRARCPCAKGHGAARCLWLVGGAAMVALRESKDIWSESLRSTGANRGRDALAGSCDGLGPEELCTLPLLAARCASCRPRALLPYLHASRQI